MKKVLLSAAMATAFFGMAAANAADTNVGALLMEWSPPISCATVGR